MIRKFKHCKCISTENVIKRKKWVSESTKSHTDGHNSFNHWRHITMLLSQNLPNSAISEYSATQTILLNAQRYRHCNIHVHQGTNRGIINWKHRCKIGPNPGTTIHCCCSHGRSGRSIVHSAPSHGSNVK